LFGQSLTPTSPDRLLAFLTEREGEFPTEYKDSMGLWTVGIGHLLHGTEHAQKAVLIDKVKCSFPLSHEQCVNLLLQDLAPAKATVDKAVKVVLTKGEEACLTSFTFNVGSGAFLDSTLLRRLNVGDYQAVPDQLRRWVKDSRTKLTVQGLVNRREKEILLWSS
jgi:lysozyme